MPQQKAPSVIVITKDEEKNIANCLRTLSFSDDIVVLDSYSKDRTVEIARSFPNVRVIQRVFDTEYVHRNYGLHEIQYKNDWVYVCDADETVPSELAEEMLAKVNDPANRHAAFRLRYKNMFMDKWLRHASGQSVWVIRLVRPMLASYEVRATNVHPIVQGSIGELRNRFIHHSFNSGLRRWFHKHNFYSSREAHEGVRVRRENSPSMSKLFRGDGDAMSRRRTLKNLSYFLKARALWRFLHMYVLSGGWLDGTPGFHYCSMVAMYEYWIELKMRETEHSWQRETVELSQRLLDEPGSNA